MIWYLQQKIESQKENMVLLNFILSLKADNLYKGPEVDRDYPNETLYIFKKEIIKNVVFYVKLKFKDGVIKILSCHEDE